MVRTRRDVDVTDAPVEIASSRDATRDATPDGGEPDERLSTKQAAALIGVTEERLRTLAGDGRVPAEMVSHKWWFSKNELLRMKRECPEALYARRTPAVVAVTQARRERSRAIMLRLNARQDRHKAAMAGYLGLLAKIAREVDPQNKLPPDERERLVQMTYRAQLAEARSRKRTASRAPMTREELIAQAEERARRQVAQEHRIGDGEQQPLSICYQCWRESVPGRPPAKLVNVLCERHQRENDEFAASLRDSGEEE